MQPNPLRRAQYSWIEGNYPLTKLIIAVNVVTILLSLGGVPVHAWLGFVSIQRPWTFFTYPLVSVDPLGALFYGIWLYWIGGSLERSWGTSFFGRYFALMTIITSVSMFVGYLLLAGMPVTEAGLSVTNWLPISALTVAWCMLNPEQVILFWGIIPILAKWIAVGEVLVIFFTHFRIHPLMGLLALSGCFASFLWVRYRAWGNIYLYSSLPHSSRKKARPQRSPEDKFTWRDLNPLEWIARWRRKRQFMRLWKDD